MYDKLLEVLRSYHLGSQIQPVYKQVHNLLRDDKELLDEFATFLPEVLMWSHAEGILNAIFEGDRGKAKALILKEPREFLDGPEATKIFCEASERGLIDVIGLILEKAPSIVQTSNQEGLSPLLLAARGGHLETVQLLLKNKADPRKLSSYEPLLFSSYHSQEHNCLSAQFCDICLTEDMDPDDTDASPLEKLKRIRRESQQHGQITKKVTHPTVLLERVARMRELASAPPVKNVECYWRALLSLRQDAHTLKPSDIEDKSKIKINKCDTRNTIKCPLSPLLSVAINSTDPKVADKSVPTLPSLATLRSLEELTPRSSTDDSISTTSSTRTTSASSSASHTLSTSVSAHPPASKYPSPFSPSVIQAKASELARLRHIIQRIAFSDRHVQGGADLESLARDTINIDQKTAVARRNALIKELLPLCRQAIASSEEQMRLLDIKEGELKILKIRLDRLCQELATDGHHCVDLGSAVTPNRVLDPTLTVSAHGGEDVAQSGSSCPSSPLDVPSGKREKVSKTRKLTQERSELVWACGCPRLSWSHPVMKQLEEKREALSDAVQRQLSVVSTAITASDAQSSNSKPATRDSSSHSDNRTSGAIFGSISHSTHSADRNSSMVCSWDPKSEICSAEDGSDAHGAVTSITHRESQQRSDYFCKDANLHALHAWRAIEDDVKEQCRALHTWVLLAEGLFYQELRQLRIQLAAECMDLDELFTRYAQSFRHQRNNLRKEVYSLTESVQDLEAVLNTLSLQDDAKRKYQAFRERILDLDEEIVIQEMRVKRGRQDNTELMEKRRQLEEIRKLPEYQRVTRELHQVLQLLPELAKDFPELSLFHGTSVQHLFVRNFDTDYVDRRKLTKTSTHIMFEARLRVEGQKVMLTEFVVSGSGADSDVKALRRTLNTLSLLKHPNVVPLEGIACSYKPGGMQNWFVQMPYYPWTLAEWVAKHRAKQSPDTWRKSVLAILRGVCEGLAELHRHNIVHRDLNPSNIMVTIDNVPVLTDLTHAAGGKGNTTPPQDLSDSPSSPYTDPQIRSKREPYSAASDMFALGVIASELIVGKALTSPQGIDTLDSRERRNLDRDQENLLRALLCPKSKERPTATETLQHPFLVGEPPQRSCVICLDLVSDVDGVRCDGICHHFICKDCLSNYVVSKASEDLRLLQVRQARVMCPMPHCNSTHFSDADVACNTTAQAFAVHIQARMRLIEQRVSTEVESRIALELRSLLAMNPHERRVYEARKHVVDNILTLRCPRCDQAFFDFDGCFAISCSACQCSFCAWCLQDCGHDSHAHAASCSESFQPGSVFGSIAMFEQACRKRREKVGPANSVVVL